MELEGYTLSNLPGVYQDRKSADLIEIEINIYVPSRLVNFFISDCWQSTHTHTQIRPIYASIITFQRLFDQLLSIMCIIDDDFFICFQWKL